MFPGKTFAFVNYYSTATAAMAQEALDNVHVPAIAGLYTPLIMFRFEAMQ